MSKRDWIGSVAASCEPFPGPEVLDFRGEYAVEGFQRLVREAISTRF